MSRHQDMDGDDEASFEEIKTTEHEEQEVENVISKKSKKVKAKKEKNDPETIEKMLKRARESMQEDGQNFPVKYDDMKYLDDLDLSMGKFFFSKQFDDNILIYYCFIIVSICFYRLIFLESSVSEETPKKWDDGLTQEEKDEPFYADLYYDSNDSENEV